MTTPATVPETQDPKDKLSRQSLFAEVNDLRAVREVLKVQAHLFKAEVKDSFGALEARFREVEQKLAHLDASKTSATDLVTAMRPMIEELKGRYRHFQKGIDVKR